MTTLANRDRLKARRAKRIYTKPTPSCIKPGATGAGENSNNPPNIMWLVAMIAPA
jgi:hypothetical protein